MTDRVFRWRWFGLALLGWSVYGVFEAVQGYLLARLSGSAGDARMQVTFAAASVVIMATLTLPILAAARRFPIARPHRLRHFVLHLGFALVTTAVFLGLLRVTQRLVTGKASEVAFILVYLRFALPNVWSYFVLVAGEHVFRSDLRLREHEVQSATLASELASARLELLRMQLHPHFLFNTLNTISELIHQNPAAADQTVTRLAHLLRTALNLEGAAEVPLARELDVLEAYLAVQRVRFGDRIEATVDARGAPLDALVPPLLLQPLVENAYRHGLAGRVGAGRVTVRVTGDGGWLSLVVADDGVGPPADVRDGLGFRTTRARLRELYGADHEFTLERRQPAGAVATLRLPLRRAAASG